MLLGIISSSHTPEAQSSNKDKLEETNLKFGQIGKFWRILTQQASDFHQYLRHSQPELQGKAWREKVMIFTLLSTSTSNA